MNKQIFFILLFLSSVSGPLWSQPLEDWIEAAETAFDRNDFYSAYRYYDVAIKYDTSRMDLWYKLGESAQHFTAYQTAERAYAQVAASTYRDSFPLLLFHQAQVQQKLGNYATASALYDTFITEVAAAPAEELQEAERNLINCEWAVDVASRPAETTVRHLENNVNSPYSDFGLFRKGDTLYFSTMREVFQKDSLRPRRQRIELMRLLPGATIEPLPKRINQANRLAAHTAYDTDGDRVFFTICDYQGATADIRCELYSSRIGKNGQWENPVRLSINDEAATNTHPNVGLDPLSGDEYLYFASDRTGGEGQLDIYRSLIRANGDLGTPEPMSDWNTPGNDVTPFYYAPTQVMYFSTDGRLTMGGFDVYRSSWSGDDWGRPTNMGVPVNSSYNDLYYSRYIDEELAYFASNRPDSAAIFWDETKDACCNDIYSVGITDEIKLLALTFDKRDLTELAGATVYLYEVGPNGRRVVDSLTNPLANDFNFTVEPGKKYELLAQREGYTQALDSFDLNDPDLVGMKEVERKLYLSPGIELDVLTFNGMDSTALAGTTVLLYEITPEGQVLVDSIVNPTDNDFKFSVLRGKEYLVFARKDGFTPSSSYIDTRDPALANVSRIERKLYLDPGLVLEVYTFRTLDNTALSGARVYLYEYTTEGEVLLDSLENPYGNQFGFPISPGKRYIIKGERDGYGPVEEFLDLSGPDAPQTGTVRKDLYLGQLLEIFTYDAETELPLPGVKIRLLDPMTGDLIAERTNAEGHEFRYTINLDQPFIVEATRKGYVDVIDTLSFTLADLTRMGGTLSFDLYLQPLDDPMALLPLILYYDNDHPDPRSYRSTTDKEYVGTNEQYYQRKQQFIQSFTEGMELEEAFLTRRRFNEFFDREVKGSRYDLDLFSEKLAAYLDSGQTFQLELRGFASPRASEGYNRILSNRRIDAVRNYFEKYNDGVLDRHIKSGALTFTTLPLGETQADPRVIDKLSDPRNSIYGIFASLERRVEVRSADEN